MKLSWRMVRWMPLFIIFILFYKEALSQSLQGPKGEKFTLDVLGQGFDDPWQLRLDEPGYLWFTESKSFRVIRMKLDTKDTVVVLDLSKLLNYPRYDTTDDKKDGGKPMPAGGLMGLAMHPEFLQGKPYVYLNYVSRFKGAKARGKGCADKRGGCFFTATVVRYTFDAQLKQLIKPTVLCDTIPASNDHNGSRLLIAPVNNTFYLFYSIGDMGAGQFDNAGRKNHAQNTNSYEGKVLRFNIEPDSGVKGLSRWIPADNPFNHKIRNAVWTYGHRNPQGLFYAVINNRGILYSSEHGPYSDDEINIIDRGKNYGHPLIIGFADGNYNGLAAGVSAASYLPHKWKTTYPDIVSETEMAKTLGESFRPPLFSLYPTEQTILRSIFTRLSKNENDRPEWRSEAPSSIAVYSSKAIPGWKNSLLLPCLKTGRLLRLQLSEDGMDIAGDTMSYFESDMRYRDIAVSADGRTLYLAVDKSAVTSGPSAKEATPTGYRGAILALRYQQ